MVKFLIGFVFGVLVATVGLSGIGRLADNVVDKIKIQSQELAR